MSSDETELVNQRNTDKYDLDIGRANGGQSHLNNTDVGEPGWLGNPYPVSEHGRERSIRMYELDFHERRETDAEFREALFELEGKTLACWCTPKPCHGDVILDYLPGNTHATRTTQTRLTEVNHEQ